MRTAKLFVVGTTTDLVLRYAISGPTDRPNAPELEITDPTFNRLVAAAFHPSGELFLVNRGPDPLPASGTAGSVTRILDATTEPISNGAIVSDAFKGPHFCAFRGRELFIAQRFGNNTLRIFIGDDGDPVFNPPITEDLGGNFPRGVVANPNSSDVYVTECFPHNELNIYRVEGPEPVFVGSLRDNLSNPHGMAFTPWGELFVVNASSNSISRYTVDANGALVPNGSFEGNGMSVPLGLAFSPWGELFIASQGAARLSRFLFDDQRNATPNGIVELPFASSDVAFALTPNNPPVADAGSDQTVSAGVNCRTDVTLDGSASSDPDGDPITFSWDRSGEVKTGPRPTFSLGLGVHTITLTVEDGQGGRSTDEVTVTVADSTAPRIERVTASPAKLWPPNHKMVAVSVSVVATDGCDPAPRSRIVSVTSNEPPDGNDPDFEITGSLTLKLRAERQGGGNGRTYTITVACKDASGNESTATTTVVVPHNN